MVTITRIADEIGEHICKQAGLESELKKICFGIEVILVMLISIVLTIIFGAALGMLSETMIVISSALVVKFLIGSPHLSSFFRCLLYSIAIILIGAWLCSVYPFWLTSNIALILGLFNLVILIGMPLRPSYRSLAIKQILTRKLAIGFMIFSCLILYIKYPSLLYAGALIGISISILNTSPVGVNFTKWLDRITKQGGAVQ